MDANSLFFKKKIGAENSMRCVGYDEDFQRQVSMMQ